MTNLNAVMEISKKCKENKIQMTIDGSGVILSTCRNNRFISKHYDLNTINIITLEDFPIEVIIDIFIEEAVLNFKQATA